ncbi:MAG: GNAT family N-acetyltransferase, partial [Proteobacteria bacterium]
LDALSIEARAESWKRSCELNNPPNILLVAELDKQIVGIASGLEHRFKAELPTCDCELAAVYVDPTRTKSGVGRALLQRFKIEVQKLGKTKLCIWTLEANTTARRFYERQGGVQSGSKSFSIGNQTLHEVGYTFDL